MIAFEPHAVVFDCDGTLMDSNGCVRHAVDRALERRELSPDTELYCRVTGLAVPDIAAMIATLVGEPASELADELLAAMIEHASTTAAPLPGALDLVRRVSARFPVAIASNAPRALLDETLAAGGLNTLVPITIAADEVRAPKPAPDLYLTACRRIGVPPHRVLAIEDSPVGVRSAHAAGLTVLGLTPAHHSIGADAHTDRLDAPALTRWIENWPIATAANV